MEPDQEERPITTAHSASNQPPQQPVSQLPATQPILDNQSNLLQSKLITNPNSFDQVPIGGGKKFNFSQFPQEGDAFKPPPPKKNIVKKAPKKPLPNNQQLPNNQNNLATQNTPKPFNEDAPLPKSTQPLDQIPVGGNKNNQFGQFDQKPIGKGTFNLSQFPEGEQQPQQQKEYPMLQKLKSKAAKLRLSGMEDLLKLLQENPDHPDISEIDVKAMVKQTTPANLDKGLHVLRLWVQKGKKWGDEQIKNAIENGMAKVNTKKVTIEICDMMFEQNASSVETAILLGMKGKIAKNIAYYLTMIVELLAIYGIKKMKYLKPYIPEVVKLLNDKKDIAIKNEGMIIIKEAYKWLGKDVISPMLGELKENIKKEIDAFWDSYDQTIVMKAPKGQQEAETGDGKKKKKVDAYQLSQAVDVFKKFNQKWSEGVLQAAKWSEKTKMLQDFVKAASVPKLANAEFRHISEMIKRLINDSNFNVVIWDLKVLAVMSRGLRRNFQYVVKNVFANVLAKFRDKKTQMIEQTFNTLNDFLYCISIEEVLDDVKDGLQDKAPNMKVNVINWIGKFVQLKAEQKGELPKNSLDALKQLFPIFEKLINDGNVEVRDCMARNIFKMKLTIGDQFFAPIEAKMNKNLASKVVDAKPTGKAVSKKQKTPEKPEKQMGKSAVGFNKPGAGKQMEKSSLMKTQNIKPGQEAKQSKKAQEPELVLEKFEEPSLDDSCQKLLQYGFPEEEIKNIKAPGAKQRTNVMNLLKADSYDLLTTFSVMRELFKDWKEVNLLMNKELIAFIEQKSNQIDKPELVIIIPFIIQKIGDNKFSEPLYRALENICQKIPGTFVVGYLIEKIKALENKKPKLNADVCGCICRIIDFVSVNNIPVRETILFANECFKIQFSKKGGVDLIKKIYSYIGQQTKIYLEPETYNSLEPELKKTKILTEEEKKPKIQFSGQAKKAQKKTVNLLENKPKLDITIKIQDLLPKMNDNSNWQNRKETAEAIMSLVNDNFGRVTIGCMNDLMNNLKTRINDPNKNIIKTFMQLTGVLFPVLSDKQLKVFTKMFITTLADALSDKVEANKKEAAATLNKIGEVVGKEQLLSTLAPYLQSDKESRVEIISIMLANQQALQKTQMKDFPKGITNCLCDKNKQIRNLAEKLFEKVYQRIGIDTFRNIAKNQRPAITKDLNNIYDKYDSKRQSVSVSQGSQSYISKASSPAKDTKPNPMDRRNPPLTNSAKKRSVSKNQRSTIEIEADEPDYSSNNRSRVMMPQQKVNINQSVSTLVSGDQFFAPMNYLTLYRVERQQHHGHFLLEEFTDQQEDMLKEQITLLINPNLVKKMFSFNQKRVADAILQLIKLCKEITYQNHFREIYDLLLKWSLMRLWGGSPALLSIVEVFPPILSILQKKKLTLNDFEVDLIIAVIRQYFISSFMNEFKVSESLHIIVRSLVSLSSGQRVVKKILRQFSYELTTIHRHLKKDVNVFYRDGLSKLTKMHLMDFIGNQDTLEETSKIKELRGDAQFVEMLYRKFHETVLNHFGFRNFVQPNQSGLQQNISQTFNQTISHSNQPPLPPQPNPMAQTHSVIPRRERSVSNESRKREKSVERVPNMMKREANNSRVNLDANNASSISNKPKPGQSNPSIVPVNNNAQQPRIPVVAQMNPVAERQGHLPGANQFVTQSSYPQQQPQVNVSNTSSNFLTQGNPSSVASSRANLQNDPFSSYPQSTMANIRGQPQQYQPITSQDINLSVYPAPHPISPLGKHLSKLTPPNDQVIKFFTELFSEHSDKIANELTIHAKIIYASILKSVMEILENRQQYAPERIVAQLNLFQLCIKCKNVIRNIDLQLLKQGVNFTLRQLVYEDENKALIHQDLVSRGIEYKIQNFIKVINGVMLRILQNGNPQDVVNTLIIINNQFIRLPQPSTKTIYLIMKCTSRVAQSYTAELKLDGVIDFFIAINQYFAIDPPTTTLQDFNLPTKEKPTPNENFLNSIKAIIAQLCKIIGSDIWQLYEKAMQQAKYQDTYIAPFIQSMKINKFAQKNQFSKNTGRLAERSGDNDELKKISDLLSKHKTFDTGILHLKKYAQMNQDFSPIQYFTSLGYDQKFIAMVMNGLEGKERRTPRKDTKQGQNAKSKSPIGNPNAVSQQENIQEKIRKLKQKFSDLQPQESTQPAYEQSSASKTTVQQEVKNQKQERALQIKRRIDEMKNRLNQNPR